MSAIVESREGKHVFRTCGGVYVDQMGYSDWLGEYCVGPMANGEEPQMRSFDRGKALRALRTGTCACGKGLIFLENHRCGEDVELYAELYAARVQAAKDQVAEIYAGELSAPLEIPDAAIKAGSDVLLAAVRRIAAPVVANELRRIASEWSHTGVMYSVLRDLRARADEIEAAS